MLLISTILYFGEEPIGYNVYREDGEFRFTPAVDSHCSMTPPEIRAKQDGGEWSYEGTGDVQLHDQLARIIHINTLVDLSGGLSAAS